MHADHARNRQSLFPLLRARAHNCRRCRNRLRAFRSTARISNVTPAASGWWPTPAAAAATRSSSTHSRRWCASPIAARRRRPRRSTARASSRRFPGASTATICRRFGRPRTRALGTFFMPRHCTELKGRIETALRQVGFRRCHWRTMPVRFTASTRPGAATAGDPSGRRARRRPAAPLRPRCIAPASGWITLPRVRIRGFPSCRCPRRRWSTRDVTPSELTDFYPDLRDPEFSSAIAVVHQRFSTNTARRCGRWRSRSTAGAQR